MSHTEKAALYLAESAKALNLANTTTAGMRKEWLVIASNYANLASQELAVEHSDFCQSK
jgi:hypothetical protein